VATLLVTAAAVVAPVILGGLDGYRLCLRLRARELARAIFAAPKMAKPVTIAFFQTVMFHPQLGVLDYLLSLVDLPPSARVYDSATVIQTNPR
jgi:multiple sugar transport system permease protein